MEENKYLYMLNLTRARLFLMGFFIFGLLSLFFFIGWVVGIKSGSSDSRSTKQELAANQDGSINDVALSDGLQKTNETGDSKLPFKASTGHLSPLNGTPSSGLLASDKMNSKSKSPGNQEELAALPDFSTKKSSKAPSKSTAEKPSAEKASSTGDHYYLQLLATSEKTKAETASSLLSKKSYHAYLKTKQDTTGKTIYMVRVGSYEDRQKALHDLNLLREKNGYKDSYMVILKNGKTDSPTAAAPNSPAISSL